MCCGCGHQGQRFRSTCLRCGAVQLGELPASCAICGYSTMRVEPHPADGRLDPRLTEDPDERPYIWELD